MTFKFLRRNSGLFQLSAFIAAIAHLIPDRYPFTSPDKWAATACTAFLWQLRLLPHTRHSHFSDIETDSTATLSTSKKRIGIVPPDLRRDSAERTNSSLRTRMKDATPQTIYLADYMPFGWTVEDVHLTFSLSPNATRVKSRMRFAPNSAGDQSAFFLDGEQLALVSAAIDGHAVQPEISDKGLTCAVPSGAFTWEAEVEIDPAANTSLEGLYMSNGMYCTQCEAEGFRKITYYPDRPDVMAPFTVRIESDLPVLLSNGNPLSSGAGFAEWQDPWHK